MRDASIISTGAKLRDVRRRGSTAPPSTVPLRRLIQRPEWTLRMTAKIIEPGAAVAKRISRRESCAALISQYLQYVSRVAVPKVRAIMLGFVNVTSPFKARAYS